MMRLLLFYCIPTLILSFGDVYAATATDQWVNMVTNPYLIPFILTVGLVGIAVEFLFPGLIVPGAIGVSAFGIYFLGYYLAGSISWDAPALFVMGIVLLILEVVIPSFGIIGILGCLFLVTSFMMTAPNWEVGVVSLAVGLGLTILFLWILSRFVKFRSIWNRFILKDSQQNTEGYTSHKDRSHLLGKIGITTTPLQSSGYARFDEDVEDVISQGASIPKDVKVKVIAVEGTRVVVRQVFSD